MDFEHRGMWTVPARRSEDPAGTPIRRPGAGGSCSRSACHGTGTVGARLGILLFLAVAACQNASVPDNASAPDNAGAPNNAGAPDSAGAPDNASAPEPQRPALELAAAPEQQQQALELAAEASDTTDAERDYKAYIAALEAGDKEAAKPYVYLDWQLTATVVDHESILSAHRNGDKVVLILGGNFAGVTNRNGSKARTVGTVRMLREGDRWKVRSRRWDINPIANPVSEATAWLVSAER